MPIEWVERRDESVEAIAKHPGLSRGQVRIMAENIRDQQSGIHAHVVIGYGDPQNGSFDLIEDDTFNLGRRPDRNGLAGAAAEGIITKHNRETAKEAHLPTNLRSDQGKVFVGTVKEWLRDFCNDAWNQHIGHFLATWTPGSLEPRPPRWLIRPWSQLDASAILFGREGGGKSTLMLIWAMMVTHGVDSIFGEVSEAMPVLFVNLERPEEQLKDQIGNIAEALGLPRETELPLINARGHSLREVSPAIRQFVEEHGKRCVVALDSISRGITGDLNANDAANELVNLMNSFGCTWWAVAHEAKDPEKKRKERTIFGAGAFAWAADATVALSWQDPTPFRKEITIQTGKVNNAPRSGRQVFALDFEEDRGLVAFGRLGADAVGDLGKSPSQALRDRLIDHLGKVGRQTYEQLAEALDVSERGLRKVMTDNPQFGHTITRPFVFYLAEGIRNGTQEAFRISSGSSSGSPLDPSDPDLSDTKGQGPLKGPLSPYGVSAISTGQPEGGSEDSKTETAQPVPVDETKCWVCGQPNEPARFTGAGNMICTECDKSGDG